jgi:GrpB-like predicted nucleotidyltransferase (UPF0157 family)
MALRGNQKLKPRVELVTHDPAWARAALAEALRLATVFGSNHGDIQHIGSTAIAGIKAKPTIDLLPRVHSLDVLDEQSDDIRALGYRWHGELGIAGRRLFTRDDPATGRACSTYTRSHMGQRTSIGISRFEIICARTRAKRGLTSGKRKALRDFTRMTLSPTTRRSPPGSRPVSCAPWRGGVRAGREARSHQSEDGGNFPNALGRSTVTATLSSNAPGCFQVVAVTV